MGSQLNICVQFLMRPVRRKYSTIKILMFKKYKLKKKSCQYEISFCLTCAKSSVQSMLSAPCVTCLQIVHKLQLQCPVDTNCTEECEMCVMLRCAVCNV